MKRIWILALLMCTCGLSREVAGQTKSVAVMRFENRSSFPENEWIGVGFSEIIATKLSLVESITLVERLKINEVLATAKKSDLINETQQNEAEAARSILGVEYLLIGSVQSLGSYKDENTKIKVSARIIKTESAAIKGDASFTIDGTIKELFGIQTKMAAQFCRALNVDATVNELGYEEAMNITAQQLYADGMNQLYKHEYKKAIDLFRQALNNNEGSFYSVAHTMEGIARQKQIESAGANDQEKLKKEYLDQFRSDAAQAAPAFYDLGTAYKATQQWDDAIKAYSDFLRYAGANAKVVVWKKTLPDGMYIMGDDKIYRAFENDSKLVTYSLESGDQVSEIKIKNHVFCKNLIFSNGRVLWDAYDRITCIDPSNPEPIWKYEDSFDERSPLVIGDGMIAWLSGKKVYGIDALTGKKLWSTSSETSKPSSILIDKKTAFVNNDGKFERDAYVSAYDFTAKKARRAEKERLLAIGLDLSLYLSDQYVKGIDKANESQVWSVWDTDISPGKQKPYFQMAVADSQNFYLVSRDADITSGYSEYGLSKKFIVCLESKTGKVRWQYSVDGFLSPEMYASHGLLFCATRYGNAVKLQGDKSINVFAIDVRTGEKVWKHEIPEHVAKFVVNNDYLFVATEKESNSNNLYTYVFRISNMVKPRLMYTDMDARLQTAHCLLRKGDLVAAETETKNLLDEKKDFLPAHFMMSLIHRVRGNSAEELASLHHYYLRGNFEDVKERVYELSGIKQVYKFPTHERAHLARNGNDIFLRLDFGSTTNHHIYQLGRDAKLHTTISHNYGTWGSDYNYSGKPVKDTERSVEYSFNFGSAFNYGSWSSGKTTPFSAYTEKKLKWRIDFLIPYYDGWGNGYRGCYRNEKEDVLYISSGDGLVHAVDLKKVDELLSQGKKWWKE